MLATKKEIENSNNFLEKNLTELEGVMATVLDELTNRGCDNSEMTHNYNKIVEELKLIINN